MLELKKITCGYDGAPMLHEFDLTAQKGKITCLMGRNGAGKTTCLKAIIGAVRLFSGEIHFDGARIDNLPAHQVVHHRISYVPQGRRLFSDMTVLENIQIGLAVNHSGHTVLERMLDMFPILRERLKQKAGTLSGGEQQMLAMARALAIKPNLLLLDEPMEGLQPSVVDKITEVILYLKKSGVSVLLVEQRIDCVKAAADKVVFVENGLSREQVAVSEITANSPLLKKYIGV